jgi:hypothetical protein
VYSVCLVGYGWSDKGDVAYSHDLWGAQIQDFIKEVTAATRRSFYRILARIRGQFVCLVYL